MVLFNSLWIIKFYYVFQDFFNLYLVMEFYAGGDFFLFLFRYKLKLNKNELLDRV